MPRWKRDFISSVRTPVYVHFAFFRGVPFCQICILFLATLLFECLGVKHYCNRISFTLCWKRSFFFSFSSPLFPVCVWFNLSCAIQKSYVIVFRGFIFIAWMRFNAFYGFFDAFMMLECNIGESEWKLINFYEIFFIYRSIRSVLNHVDDSSAMNKRNYDVYSNSTF